MKRHAILILTVGLLLAADSRQAVKEELQRLQGEWRLVYAEVSGEVVPEDSFQGERTILKGDRLTVLKGGKVLLRATMRFDPTTSPPTFVETIADGTSRGRKFHGIYELTGDTLRSCGVSADQERPREFTSRNGEKLFVIQRVKP
jgi:uncharacterized protein (TIGR03067 family)